MSAKRSYRVWRLSSVVFPNVTVSSPDYLYKNWLENNHPNRHVALISVFIILAVTTGCVTGRVLDSTKTDGLQAAKLFTQLVVGHTVVWKGYTVQYNEGGAVLTSGSGDIHEWYRDRTDILCQTMSGRSDLCWGDIVRRLEVLGDNKYRLTTNAFVDDFCLLEKDPRCSETAFQ